MSVFELLIIAVGLSMDAFAVSICKGLSLQKMEWKNGLKAGLYFGGFQALMPLIGFFLGVNFRKQIESVDHWIAFVLLVLIGLNMVKESREKAEELDSSFDVKTMLLLAVATSIDALAVGVTFAFLKVDIVAAVCAIGFITFWFGNKNWKCIWGKVQVKSRISRGAYFNFNGDKNIVGTSGHTFHIK